MLKYILAFVAAVVLAGSVGFVQASGGGGSGSGSGGGGGSGSGGGGGGGSPTVRYVGFVSDIVDAPEGVYVTIGTSYYNTGTVLVDSSTKITLNSVNATIADLDVGDYVETAATLTGVAVRLNIVIP